MRAKNVWIVIVCGVLLQSAHVWAQDAKPTDAKKEQIKELQGQVRELKKGLSEVGKRLNLNKDEGLIQLKKAVADANAAYREAFTAKLKADPRGAELMGKVAEIEGQIKELSKRPPKQKKEKKPKGQ